MKWININRFTTTAASYWSRSSHFLHRFQNARRKIKYRVRVFHPVRLNKSGYFQIVFLRDKKSHYIFYGVNWNTFWNKAVTRINGLLYNHHCIFINGSSFVLYDISLFCRQHIFNCGLHPFIISGCRFFTAADAFAVSYPEMWTWIYIFL